MKLDKPYAAAYIEDAAPRTDGIGARDIDGATHESGAFELAMDLIGLSLCQRTCTHLFAIDALLKRAAVARHSAQRFFDEAWPHIRARLLSYPPF